MARLNIAELRKQMDEKTPQSLQGNGATPPPPTRDQPTVTSRAEQRTATSKARRLAVKNMLTAERANPKSSSQRGSRDTGAEDSGVVDSPLGRRLPQSGKKNPFLRVN